MYFNQAKLKMLQFMNDCIQGEGLEWSFIKTVYSGGGLCIRTSEMPSREMNLISGQLEEDSLLPKESGCNLLNQSLALLAESAGSVANKAWTWNNYFRNHIIDGTNSADSGMGLDSHSHMLEVQALGWKVPNNPQHLANARVTCFPRIPYRWPVGGFQSGEWRTEHSRTSRPKMKRDTKLVPKSGHFESTKPSLNVHFPRPYHNRGR